MSQNRTDIKAGEIVEDIELEGDVQADAQFWRDVKRQVDQRKALERPEAEDRSGTPGRHD